MFTKTSIPQYFFGDDMQQSDKTVKNDSVLSKLSLVVEDFHASEPNLSRIPSPASSVASTKKLEWDSGADIGYNVYNSFKNSRRSKSFPSLNMDLSLSQINKSNESQGDEIDTKNKLTDDVTRENVNKNHPCTSEFKSQEITRKPSFIHSTPNDNKMVNTTSLNSDKDKFSKSNKDECLQTTLIRICSKSVQTENNTVTNENKVNKSQQTETLASQSSSSGNSLSKSSSFQYIPACIKTKSSDNSTTKSDSHKSLSIKSEGKNESLKYLSDNSYPDTSKSKCTESTASKSKSKISNSSQSTQVSCSSTSPLGKMIATQQSEHLIKDVDKSLQILQNFIKSKNYTPDTKKYYARKIMNKIITTKYSEDSSSNSSSDSSLLANKLKKQPIKPNIKSEIDIQNKENIKTPKQVHCGVQCIPIQHDVSTLTSKNKKLARKLEELINKNASKGTQFKNNSDNNISNENISEEPIKPNITSKSYFDTHDKENIKSSNKVNCGVQCTPNNDSIKSRKNEILAKKLEELINKNSEITETVKQKNKSTTDLPNKNWREPETMSEKLFEARRKSINSSEECNLSKEFTKLNTKEQGNYVIQHSKNERKRQLSWINNEILYLHKLKELLQTNESTSNSTVVNTESNKNSPISSNKIDDSNSTKHSISDIESKFYQEFGPQPPPYIKKMEHIKKISKYFNSDQIKFLLFKNGKMCCKSCDSCKDHTDISQNNDENKFSETQNKSHQELERQNDSYCSHTHRLYENGIKSKENSSLQTEKDLRKSDASIQCCLRKKEQSNYNLNESSECSCDSNKVQIYFKNELISSDSQSINCVITNESESVIEYESTSEKEDYYRKKSPKNRNNINPYKPVAYYLTFDERKINLSQNVKKNKLQQVIVKVPKIVSPEKKKKRSGSLCRTLTLQEYLLRNRPNFVEAADWRQSVISNRTEKKFKNIFTCSQMKELTSKKYQQLPEIQNKKHSCKITDQRRHNRCMASMFSKKLQKKTLRGQMSIATCINVMSDSL